MFLKDVNVLLTSVFFKALEKCLLGPPSVHRWKMGDSNFHHSCVLKFLNSFLLSHCPKEFVTSQLLL